eukprot:COSAG03_NODE_9096_length_746_cov_1.180835_2_plen_115_part_00
MLTTGRTDVSPQTYGPAVDMWSVGCILAEMIQGRPLFCGQNHIHQLEVIFKLCGTPTHVNWPSHADLPWYKMFKPQHMTDRSLREHLETASVRLHPHSCCCTILPRKFLCVLLS